MLQTIEFCPLITNPAGEGCGCTCGDALGVPAQRAQEAVQALEGVFAHVLVGVDGERAHLRQEPVLCIINRFEQTRFGYGGDYLGGINTRSLEGDPPAGIAFDKTPGKDRNFRQRGSSLGPKKLKFSALPSHSPLWTQSRTELEFGS